MDCKFKISALKSSTMKVQITLLLVAMFFNSGSSNDDECPFDYRTVFRLDYQYSPEAPGYFKLFDAPTSWESARRICRLEGAELATPENSSIEAVMRTIMNKSNIMEVHTGWNSRYLPAYFMSIKALHIGYVPHHFQKDEPSRARKLYNFMSLNITGELAIRDFVRPQFPFICYKDISPIPTRNRCGTGDPRYERIFENKCYKFHNVPLTWENAVATCFGEGSQIVIIKSKEEAENLAKHHDKATIWGNGDKDLQYVGFRENITSNEWLTVFDQSLEKTGYSNWTKGYPKYSFKDNNCGAFNAKIKDGVQDYDCRKKLAFSCEMDVTEAV